MEHGRGTHRRWLRGLAGLILLAGLAGTILLYRGAPGPDAISPEAAQELPPLGPGDFKKSAREMEVLGGKTLVILESWRQGLVDGWQHNGPALLTAAGSLIVAGLLFWLGGPATQPPRQDSEQSNQ